MLESDKGDADSSLWVEFRKQSVLNEYRSEQAGHPIYEEVDFITVRVPGNSLNVVERKVLPGDKIRFPRHWAHYQNTNSNDGVEGTLIEEWPIISRSSAQELRHLGFKTVEQIAGASDTHINNLGMSAGMQPHTLRDKARAFLAAAANTAEAQAAISERDALRNEMAALKQQMAEFAAQVEADKPRRGRPPRELEAA